MKSLLEKIQKLDGFYEGTGLNHEKEEFKGILELSNILDGVGVQIRFKAHAIKNPDKVFHSEISTIAPNPKGSLSLFNLNTNTPFLAEHVLVAEENGSHELKLIFRFGELNNDRNFREEVRIDIFHNGSLGYHYSWGLPGGPFLYRSGLTLQQKK